jgi:hypothetical protein
VLPGQVLDAGHEWVASEGVVGSVMVVEVQPAVKSAEAGVARHSHR